MDDRIVARLVTPTLIAVQLGALITTLLWTFYGVSAGVPALLVSLLSVWRAVQTGFVLDNRALQMRPFLPFGIPSPIPWARLQSVDVDEVIVGTETRTKKARVRFLAEGHHQLQIIGCQPATIDAVLERFRSNGLGVTDGRGKC